MRLTPVAVLAAAACLLAACTSSSTSDAPDSSSPPTTAVTSTAPSTTPVVTTPPPTTAPPTTKAPTATKTTSASSTAAPRPTAPSFTTTCRSLRVDVVKGGAIRGMEIAAMQFTNEGTSNCTITGVPVATLLRNGATVGTPSTPNSATVRPYTVRPGEYGEALLRDFSTCNAPLSDQLRLQGPSRNGTAGKIVTQPIRLRACTLQVAPVGEPS